MHSHFNAQVCSDHDSRGDCSVDLMYNYKSHQSCCGDFKEDNMLFISSSKEGILLFKIRATVVSNLYALLLDT